MGETASQGATGMQIVKLAATFEGFGLAMDYLSRTAPFSAFELGNFAGVIRAQLQHGHHLAAMDDQVLVGYAGWMLTTAKTAEAWRDGHGILYPGDPATSDAAALTVFAVSEPSATPRLIRGARELNKNMRVYFKRGYDEEARGAKKTSVLNFSPGRT